MSETRWREELAEFKADVARLRKRLAKAMPTIHKDLLLISLVPKCSGAQTTAPLEDFPSIIEGAARRGRLDHADCLHVAIL
jgi:hypothetical protein